MLMRTDSFREFDRLAQRLLESGRPAVMPMDAHRDGDDFVVHFDLPGVSHESIDLEVERNVLTVKAERPGPRRDDVEPIVHERPSGTFTRQVFLGDALDTEHIDAHYEDGVLTLRIPVAEKSKARKISVGHGADREAAAIRA
ncbi:heat-shock protein Hsp20 [Nocardiopsis sp. CNR-923]|uniref:Hsp20/alpha crystallin family protein n=1 Tax=Nocardiopsis sp. CNR-923 TaxID=1904965 RepID=UPI000965ADDB|nr:Hsp20/alpha crystallin family protein [Nocardiopsis sp. CNR-923]OLT25890.1 heat-shock protein Hsp20 [Nocardiopsis sp. CNR-923]